MIFQQAYAENIITHINRGTNVVLLEPDLAEVFKDSEAEIMLYVCFWIWQEMK